MQFQLQWADAKSFDIITGLVDRSAINNEQQHNKSSNGMLFVCAHRINNVVAEESLKSMIQQFEKSSTITTTQISLHGFQLECLNKMVAEALCLPRRKSRSLAKAIYVKTQGFPLFVLDFLDALWTEKLLIHDPMNGWEWDVDAIDLKSISKSVAELLSYKLTTICPDVLSVTQVLSCFGSHVDIEVLEAVKCYDGGTGSTLMPALHSAVEEGLIEKAGPTYAFSHDVIRQTAFDLIPAADQGQLLQKLVSFLIPLCMQEERSEELLFSTVGLIHRITSDTTITIDSTQSKHFAQILELHHTNGEAEEAIEA